MQKVAVVKTDGSKGWKVFIAGVPIDKNTPPFRHIEMLPNGRSRIGVFGDIENIPSRIMKIKDSHNQMRALNSFHKEDHYRTRELIYKAYPELKSIPHIEEFGTVKLLYREELPIPASNWREIEVPDHLLPYPFDE